MMAAPMPSPIGHTLAGLTVGWLGEVALKKEAMAHRASVEPSHQQGKMKICNDEAGKKNLHGDERRAFMSACLKG